METALTLLACLLPLVLFLGIVGVVPGSDGTTPPTGRQAKTGDAVVSQGHGKYYEMASRGLVFAACDQGVGVALQTTISGTVTLSLHNPVSSTKRLEILFVNLVYFSGTMPSGAIYHGTLGIGSGLPTGGTALTATATDIGNVSGVAPVGVCLAGSTVLAAKPLYPWLGTFAQLATSSIGFEFIREDVEGLIILEPGCQYQLLSVCGAAGTTPKVSPGIVWMEVPIVGTQG